MSGFGFRATFTAEFAEARPSVSVSRRLRSCWKAQVPPSVDDPCSRNSHTDRLVSDCRVTSSSRHQHQEAEEVLGFVGLRFAQLQSVLRLTVLGGAAGGPDLFLRPLRAGRAHGAWGFIGLGALFSSWALGFRSRRHFRFGDEFLGVSDGPPNPKSLES